METVNGIASLEDQHNDFGCPISNEFGSLNSSGSDPTTTIANPAENHANHWSQSSEAFADHYSSECAPLCSICYSDPTYMYSSQIGSHAGGFINSSNNPDQNEYYYQNSANTLPDTNHYTNSTEYLKSLQSRQINSLIKDPLNQLHVWLQSPVINSDYSSSSSPLFVQTSLRNCQSRENDLEQNAIPFLETDPRTNTNQAIMSTSISNHNSFYSSSYRISPDSFQRKNEVPNTLYPSSLVISTPNSMNLNQIRADESSSKVKHTEPHSRRSKHSGHIKKPLNAFMLFMKEMRAQVIAECTLKESAAINQILGRKWHALSREAQAKYYRLAKQEKELHQRLYPGWSARDNYATQVRRRTRTVNTTVSFDKTVTPNTNSNSKVSSNSASCCFDSNKVWSRQTNYTNAFQNSNLDYLPVSEPPLRSVKSSYIYHDSFSSPVNCEAPMLSRDIKLSSSGLFTTNRDLETTTSAFHPANLMGKSSWSYDLMSANRFPKSILDSNRLNSLEEAYLSCDRISNDVNYSTQLIPTEVRQNEPELNIDPVCGGDESEVPTNLTPPENTFETNIDYNSNRNTQFINPSYTNSTLNHLPKDYETSNVILTSPITVSTSSFGESSTPCSCCDSLENKFYSIQSNPPIFYQMDQITIQCSHDMFGERTMKNVIL